jgi:hypothetical protein
MAALVYLIDSLVSRRMPTVMGAICPVAGSWLGGWLGIIWSGGWRRRLLWIPQLFGLVGALAVLFMVLMWLALESHPLPFEVAPITSEDKRQLVRLLREKDPRDIDPGETQQLSLTSDQTNQLLNWALSIGSRERKAKVAFFADAAELNFSIGLPIPRIGVRYLNVTARGQIRVDSGRVRVQPHLLDVGRIAPPNWLVSLIGRAVIAEVEADRFAKPVLAAIERIDIDPSQITVLFGAMRLPDGMVSDVFNRMQPGSDCSILDRTYRSAMRASQCTSRRRSRWPWNDRVTATRLRRTERQSMHWRSCLATGVCRRLWVEQCRRNFRPVLCANTPMCRCAVEAIGPDISG